MALETPRVGYLTEDQFFASLKTTVTTGLTGTFQPLAATLTALSARSIGAASATDILDRAAGDARYALTGSGVTSFNTRTGAVTLTKADVTGTGLAKSDIGLGSADNTADAAKNVLSATKLTASRTLAATGDVTWSGSFDGSANFSVTATIAAGAVTLAKMANLAANSIIGNNTGSSATPLALTSSQVLTFLGGTTGTGTLMRSVSPTATGVLTTATDGTNGYFWATGNANTGSGIGTFLCWDGSSGRIGSYNFTGSARQPFGVFSSAFSVNIGTGGVTTALVTFDGTYGNYANDAAAAAGGVPVGSVYRNGSVLMVRVT